MAQGDHEVLNVLVIDDDEAVRSLFVDILSREEHQAVAAASAEQGLELLPFWTFQVAFIDQHLPGMDGIVLGEYLRKNNPDMMIVIITGDCDERVERRSKDLSLRFLAKPFRVQDILDVLDAWFEASRERERISSIRGGVDFEPALASFVQDLPACFAMPNVPARIEDRIVTTIRRCLNDLRSSRRYTERDRVVALAGLLAAQVLGIQLPRTSQGMTLFQEYDEIMKERGKATAFETEG
ncbi:MAG: Sporulation initiation phosphotransferase F [Deltaproteobacteria bacterium ADurb.Bin207]|jgi:CheY-like chemotaxis protein|nr:MAG: Sporulation initiation phosphotransferase F [Deltaproteobacteria bacterium ADurb.Bin207]